MTNNKFKQGHSIYIYDDEIPFIKRLLEVKKINKENLDIEQNILNLSGSYVGFIKTNRRMIEIAPKSDEVNLKHILRMYFFVNGSFHNFNDEIFSLTNDLFDYSLISLFLNELEKVTQKGLPTEYITFPQNHKFASGKINYTKSYKKILLGNEEPFSTEIDELSLDTSLNRTLKAAFNKIKNLTNKKDLLSTINKRLFNISNDYNKLDLKNVVINTKNFYCKNAFLYAKLILEESHYDSIGNFGGESFLINSDLLFEQYVKKILFTLTSDKYFTDWNEEQQYGVYNNIGKSYKPDILYKYSFNDNKSLAVIDVKNKFSSIYKNADVYQMIFYSGMLNAKKIILCYPSSYYKSPKVLEIFSDNFLNTNIYAVFINICENSKEGFSESINCFIEHLYSIITK
ncbi:MULTISPECIES: 5-methylcytosine restriction system specificity protein McrC [Staphylococcus]|uniref:5-methylcytosine restriction system specificity protein McrC n=1 Tax=Staphylococcus TaxID=1279 RepID=UPI00188760D0|nr:hypothetical protein [Staphylococcus epidermidis]MBF2285556.1 hypothetical protein [Staphylococcus epidermidis]MBF2290189.1 hypothetical protein [Staphylococcus epidermidis]MBF2292481.1 hypothetical protein [Staphylococcus epidermidis]MBF2294795.1 hypothetical protein [Staphylococcus epidermidis]MBF2299369.1 hypothetical protein [Staphylococcus epidermidis]